MNGSIEDKQILVNKSNTPCTWKEVGNTPLWLEGGRKCIWISILNIFGYTALPLQYHCDAYMISVVVNVVTYFQRTNIIGLYFKISHIFLWMYRDFAKLNFIFYSIASHNFIILINFV